MDWKSMAAGAALYVLVSGVYAYYSRRKVLHEHEAFAFKHEAFAETAPMEQQEALAVLRDSEQTPMPDAPFKIFFAEGVPDEQIDAFINAFNRRTVWSRTKPLERTPGPKSVWFQQPYSINLHDLTELSAATGEMEERYPGFRKYIALGPVSFEHPTSIPLFR